MHKALEKPVIVVLVGLAAILQMLPLPAPARTATSAANLFASLNFSINKLPPSAQVELLMKHGYKGMVASVDGATTLRTFVELPAVREGAFKLIAVYGQLNLNKPISREAMDAVARELQKAGAEYWVAFYGFVEPQELRSRIEELVDIANAHGVTVVLYPHYGSALPTTEEALRWRKAVGRNNLKVALHLCHELKAGNAARLSQIIQEAAPYLAGITIHGADREVGGEGVLGNGHGYERSIQTLGEGEFNVHDEYYLPLIRAGYQGPLVLHDFGIKDPPDHFARSMTVLQSWMEQGAQRAAEAPPRSDTAALTAMVAELQAKLTDLQDRQQISDLYLRYIRGVDRIDEQLHSSAYWPDAQLNYGSASFTAEQMWNMHLRGYPNDTQMSWAHLLTNQSVEIDGDVAHVETYVTGMAIPKEKGTGTGQGNLWAGRYIDRLERRNGEWRIAVREFIPHFTMKGATTFTTSGDAYPYSCVHTRRDTSYVRPLNKRKGTDDRAPCAH